MDGIGKRRGMKFKWKLSPLEIPGVPLWGKGYSIIEGDSEP